jgi:hypothetical protein
MQVPDAEPTANDEERLVLRVDLQAQGCGHILYIDLNGDRNPSCRLAPLRQPMLNMEGQCGETNE